MASPYADGEMLPGMLVFGRDGVALGRVKTVRDHDFLLDRLMARDVYVPFSAVLMVGSEVVTLRIDGHDVDRMGWEQPPVVA